MSKEEQAKTAKKEYVIPVVVRFGNAVGLVTAGGSQAYDANCTRKVNC